MTPDLEQAARYAAEEILGWTKQTAGWDTNGAELPEYQTNKNPNEYQDTYYLLTGNGMLELMEGLESKSYRWYVHSHAGKPFASVAHAVMSIWPDAVEAPTAPEALLLAVWRMKP